MAKVGGDDESYGGLNSHVLSAHECFEYFRGIQFTGSLRYHRERERISLTMSGRNQEA